MEMCFSVEEGRVLHGLIGDASGDIVVRLDALGFVVHASENVTELGVDLSSMLLMPHIADFAERDHTREVSFHVEQVFTGKAQSGWIEFPVRACQGHDNKDFGLNENQCELRECQRWYALSLRLVEPESGAAQGALGLLRSLQQKRALQGEIDTCALIDPLTGLANRNAFLAHLRRNVTERRDATMALFAVDGLRAIFMQYGQQTADEIQWGFAKYLETMTLPGHDLAQLDGERFGVLLPDMDMKQARLWATDVLQTFASLTVVASKRSPELTASAGLSPVERTADWTMRQAELGLVMARAGGGMQIGVCDQPARAMSSGAALELALEKTAAQAVAEAMERAKRRLA